MSFLSLNPVELLTDWLWFLCPWLVSGQITQAEHSPSLPHSPHLSPSLCCSDSCCIYPICLCFIKEGRESSVCQGKKKEKRECLQLLQGKDCSNLVYACAQNVTDRVTRHRQARQNFQHTPLVFVFPVASVTRMSFKVFKFHRS